MIVKKYRYEIKVSPCKKAEELIESNGRKNGFYIRKSSDQLIIRKPKLLFGLIPANFQVSFVVKLTEKESSTIITGKFDAPRLFYQICGLIYCLFSILFLSAAFQNGFNIQTLILTLLLGALGAVFIKVYVGISKIVFAKQNKEVLDFFQSVYSEYSPQKPSAEETV